MITTSGTAAAELLPATMEAYYTSLPLILVTADRPARFRGSGAPQAAEQVHLFGVYAHFYEEGGWKELSDLFPSHINVCLEESTHHEYPAHFSKDENKPQKKKTLPSIAQLKEFIRDVKYPLVVVGALTEEERPAVVDLLLRYQAPVYLEAPSGIREEARLVPQRISVTDSIWTDSGEAGYPIDGVLRIGGVPTVRFWRDLEQLRDKITVCSLSSSPFSGLSEGTVIYGSLTEISNGIECASSSFPAHTWLESQKSKLIFLNTLFQEEPGAEPSLIHAFSRQLSSDATIYLGNSLPIREWDLAATTLKNHPHIHCNRGVNGIDGQLSTFFGVCDPCKQNWAFLGDLTTMYDMTAPWILSQLPAKNINTVVINNGGGKIFERMFVDPSFQNRHSFNFKGFADMWQMEYHHWTQVPEKIESALRPRLIELCPNAEATARFWSRWKAEQ